MRFCQALRLLPRRAPWAARRHHKILTAALSEPAEGDSDAVKVIPGKWILKNPKWIEFVLRVTWSSSILAYTFHSRPSHSPWINIDTVGCCVDQRFTGRANMNELVSIFFINILTWVGHSFDEENIFFHLNFRVRQGKSKYPPNDTICIDEKCGCSVTQLPTTSLCSTMVVLEFHCRFMWNVEAFSDTEFAFWSKALSSGNNIISQHGIRCKGLISGHRHECAHCVCSRSSFEGKTVKTENGKW